MPGSDSPAALAEVQRRLDGIEKAIKSHNEEFHARLDTLERRLEELRGVKLEKALVAVPDKAPAPAPAVNYYFEPVPFSFSSLPSLSVPPASRKAVEDWIKAFGSESLRCRLHLDGAENVVWDGDLKK